MKNYDLLEYEVSLKSFLLSYYTLNKLNELEEKVNGMYKRKSFETEKSISHEEEYKKMETVLPIIERDWEFEKWNEELFFFNKIKKDLLLNKKYINKFVAIKNKKLIDSDIDSFRLVKRVNKKYRNDIVLIVKVEMGIPVVEIPSPEISP